MSPLISILRGTHCRSTHHYFAIDALRLVQTDAGMRLRGLLLKHHEQYLSGATDPDTRFRDFHNHVIHVEDGYFGGATRAAMQWYDRTLRHLAAKRWEEAAYATGVLTHYFTDPLMPLHTAISERECLVHRPMEWSVFHAYDRILKHWTQDDLRLVFQLGDGEGWLGEAILKGARFSNRSYRRLVESYNADLGVEDPTAALDDEAIQIFAALFGLAITGLARLIERTASEAEDRTDELLPRVSLTMASVFAVLQIPEQLWLLRGEEKIERKTIEAIVGEYRLTGTVKRNLPTEIYIKQRVLQVRDREVAWNARRRERELARGANAAQIGSQPAPATAPEEAATEPATLESIALATSPEPSRTDNATESRDSKPAIQDTAPRSAIPFASQPQGQPFRRAA
ncbi:MAG: zinc dependent phospholipase C family protein [Planctomycetaceae bacterium]